MKHEKVKDELVRQLGPRCTVIHLDLIDKYMQLWGVYDSLLDDIDERGVKYRDTSASGHTMTKNNPSVKDSLQVLREMRALLDQLGLKLDEMGPEHDNDRL